MNETMQTLLARRSCRSFEQRQLPEELLSALLEAGLYAPTGMGKQDTAFAVFQKPEDLRELSRLNAAVMGASGDPFYGAPTVILVLADPKSYTWVEDGSLAMGNLLNAAEALGLGACWIHRAQQVFRSEEGRALLRRLGVPEGYEGVGHCAVGFRRGAAQKAAPRRDGRVFRD